MLTGLASDHRPHIVSETRRGQGLYNLIKGASLCVRACVCACGCVCASVPMCLKETERVCKSMRSIDTSKLSHIINICISTLHINKATLCNPLHPLRALNAAVVEPFRGVGASRHPTAGEGINHWPLCRVRTGQRIGTHCSGPRWSWTPLPLCRGALPSIMV